MAYPDLYELTYSYTAFQQSQGDNSFPGTQLDADLAGLEDAIENVSTFTKTVIRSDGQLNNGIVTFDSLSMDLQGVGLSPAVAWATGVQWIANRTVVQNGAIYRAAVTHTAGVFAADLAAGKWIFVGTLPAGADGADGPPGANGAAGAGYGGTSTTSRLIATGSKAFTTQAALAYVVGSRVRAASNANAANYMEGVVTGYSAGVLTINVDVVGGSGTYADWNLSIAGNPGSAGSGVLASIKTTYGAVGDGVQITSNVSMTSGSPALTVSGAAFTAADVGKSISVPGVGPAGGTLVTTILSYTSATQVTLNANASTTVSAVAQRVVYGTNDITALNNAIAAINAGTIGRLYMPKGVYIANGTITTISGLGAIYGDGVGSTYIMNMSATGDIVTVSGTMNIESLAIYSSVFPRTSGISLNLTGNSSYVHNVDVLYAYLGVQNTGVLNLLVNVNINMITSRNVSANSGGVLNSGTILSCFNVKMGSGTHVNADMAEFGFKVVVGELDCTQCFVFLVNQPLCVAPGAGQTVLGVNMKGCWLDTTVGYGVNVTPMHSTAIVQLVWVSDSWIAPGANGANGYGIVIDNTVGATLQKLWFTSNYVLSYNHNTGNGVYLKGANLSAYFSNNTIGGATQAFSVGVNAIAGTTKFSFTGGSIAYNGTGVTLGAGCDYFVFNGVNEISSNGALVADSSTSVNGFFANCPGYSGWKTFTSTLGASSGAPTGTVTGKYLLTGKTVTVTYAISLTGGTGAGDLTATLPFACVSGTSFVGHGRDIAAGISLQASVISGGTTVRITTTASNAYPANSAAILATVTYEAA